MRIIIYIFFISLGGLFFSPCLAQKPPESYTQQPINPELSQLNVPVRVNINTLESIVNQQTQELIYEEKDVEGYGTSKFSIQIWKLDKIQLTGAQEDLISQVPIKIMIDGVFGAKAMGVELSQAIEKTLKLDLSFRTKISLDSNWRVNTQTRLAEYSWREKPYVQMGFFKVSLESILNQIIQNQQQVITQQIDQEVQRAFALKSIVKEVWQAFQNPWPISEWGKEKFWLTFTPQDLKLSHFYFKDNLLVTNLSIRTLTSVLLAERADTNPPLPLPPPSFTDNIPQEMSLTILTKVAKDIALDKAREMVANETYAFRNGKYKVQVKDVSMYGSDDKVVMGLALAGSAQGWMYLIGKPALDYKTELMKIDDFSYVLDGKMELSKFVRWLFAKKIRNEIRAGTEDLINERIVEIKKNLQNTLENYRVDAFTSLKGSLDSFLIDHFYLDKEQILTRIIYQGQVAVDIELF